MASGLHFIVLLCLTSDLWMDMVESRPEDAESCPSGWTWFNGHCYLVHSNEKDWADAERVCSSHDAHLSSVHGRAEYDFIRKLIVEVTGSHKTTWVGGTDAVKEGMWMWSDGSKFDFSGWAKGEPDNKKDDDCMAVNLGGQDHVGDAECWRRKPFICAK